ncbi:hypothetical protein [Novosphingobium mathurense]|uniref:Uncharacterized protein n=1 Tax=Novosphingobium mathurense TaxID=428990 RepID=A0A1U6GSM0_9SPHN|nr:hypothetical protein [Novosphingobium mathurense]SLJ86543.1 hypothetical protein SAMN06295987_101279 [Novosphingobium mathurense]
MSEPRDFASLSPRLLARKGGARPAMRPQDTSRFTAGGIPIDPRKMDDLGWNDFGHAHGCEDNVAQAPAPRPENRFSANRPVMARPEQAPARSANDAGNGHEVPEVLRQIEQLAHRMQRSEPPARTLPEGRRAAFTLRLDAERHFRLKMAGVVLNRSAQVLVTEALDKYLSEMPELFALTGTARKPS